jgi:deoxyribodipyrimidine photolyase-related protein
MGMMLNLLKKMDPEELFKIKTKANEIIANIFVLNHKGA